MTDLYNTTNFSNSNNLLEIYTNINVLSDGVFVMLLLLALFIIIFISLKSYSTKDALLAATYITGILGFLGWLAGLVNNSSIIYLASAAVLALIISFFMPKDG